MLRKGHEKVSLLFTFEILNYKPRSQRDPEWSIARGFQNNKIQATCRRRLILTWSWMWIMRLLTNLTSIISIHLQIHQALTPTSRRSIARTSSIEPAKTEPPPPSSEPMDCRSPAVPASPATKSRRRRARRLLRPSRRGRRKENAPPERSVRPSVQQLSGISPVISLAR